MLSYDTATEFTKALGVNFHDDSSAEGSTLSGDGAASSERFKEINDGYSELRKKLQEIVSDSSATVEDLLAYERDNPDLLRPGGRNAGRPTAP